MTGLRRWSDLAAPEFRDLPADTVAVLPLGATEQHGPHLAVSVDTDLIEAVLARAAPHVDPARTVLVLPTLTITKSGEHDRHPGTLSLSADTLLAVLRDIGASVARAGITRLCLFNGHGGNTAMLEVAVRELRLAHDMIAVHCSWGGFADWSGWEPRARARDIHAGDSETSAMLAAAPAKVDMGKARDFTPIMADWERRLRWIGLTGQAARPGWIVDDLNAEGACGDASAATVEKGEALLETAARGFAAFLSECAGFDHRAKG